MIKPIIYRARRYLFEKSGYLYVSYCRLVSAWSIRKWKDEFKGITDQSKNRIIVLKREKNPGSGLCALLNEYLGELRLADRLGVQSVVDLCSYRNALLDSKYVGSLNGWDSFFEPVSKFTINDVEKLEQNGWNVYCSYVNHSPMIKPSFEMFFLKNKKMLAEFSAIFSKYIRLNSKTLEYAISEFELLKKQAVDGTRICGVLLRGTDYTNLRPLGHPIQPDIDMVISDLKEVLAKYKCDFVYLASEDETICSEIKSRLGNRVIFDRSKKYSDTGNKTLSSIEDRREDDRYYSTLEYIATLYCLSKCDCLLAGRTSASPIILLMNGLKYDYYRFYDLGLY